MSNGHSVVTRNDKAPHSRDANCARAVAKSPFWNSEGAGNAGRFSSPAASGANKESTPSYSPQVRRKTSGIPRAMVLTAYSKLSPAIGLFVTVAGRNAQALSPA
jgi:hypothetical protein